MAHKMGQSRFIELDPIVLMHGFNQCCRSECQKFVNHAITPDPDTSEEASQYKRKVYVIDIGGGTCYFQQKRRYSSAKASRCKWEMHHDTGKGVAFRGC